MVQMEADRLNKCLQNIEDFVFIEEKIVTCVWLCQALKIHVNTAKQLLHAFLQSDGVADKVLVSYLIGGDLKDGSGKQIKLVEDVIRESTKSLFSRVTTDHIYSIQKSGNDLKPVDLFNSYPHFLVNTDGQRFSSVQPKKEIEKREVKVPVVESKKEAALTSSKPVKSQGKNVGKQSPTNDAAEPPSKQKKASPEENSKKLPNKAKSQGIASMFSRQADHKKAEPPPKKVKEEKKKVGSISGFFQKQPAKKQDPKPELVDADDDLPIKETSNKIEEKQKIVEEAKAESSKQVESENNKSSVKEKKLKGKENRKKRKKRDEDKEDDPRRKRKRILSVLSSDSESSGGDGESDCEMETEPAPVTVEPEVEEEDIIPPTPGRKRVRRQIDKTYTDEDGFIITKKEYVYESCTDDEGSGEKNIREKENKPEASPIIKTEDKKSSSKKSSPKEQISPNNNKSINKQQASIMNFFKRK